MLPIHEPGTSHPLFVNCNPMTRLVFDAPPMVVRMSGNACWISARFAHAARFTTLLDLTCWSLVGKFLKVGCKNYCRVQ